MLRGLLVSGTLFLMPKKTVQIRISVALANDIAIVAAALGLTVPEYAEEALRTVANRDLPKAAKIAQERADATKGKSSRPPAEGKG